MKQNELEYALQHSYSHGIYEFINFKLSIWLKIFYHSYEGNEAFANEEEALSTNTKYKYSIIKEIAQNYSHKKEFEFLIYYPEFPNQYNNWIQTKFPLYDPDNYGKEKAHGYKPVHIDLNKTSFRGLVRTNEETAYDGVVSGLLDGNIGNNGYFYCIGKYKYAACWQNRKIPGPFDVEVNEVFLFFKLSQMAVTHLRNFFIQIQFLSKIFFSTILMS